MTAPQYPATEWLRTLTFVGDLPTTEHDPPVHIPADVLTNGRDDAAFVVSNEHPVTVTWDPGSAVIVSCAVPIADVRWERRPLTDEPDGDVVVYPHSIAGLRVLSPLTTDDDAYAWETLDDTWIMAHLFVEGVAFTPKPALPDER